MLSSDDATSFLASIGVCYTEQRQKNDPLGLLNEIIPLFHYSIPFQNVTLLAKPLKNRERPRWTEIREEVMSKRGGLCYTLNTFMKYLLEAIGYSVYHICSSIVCDDNHIITVVEIQQLKYLVEVGVGYPTLEAIPIDFDKETKVYHHSFLQYKFVRESPNVIVRVHKKGDGKFSSDLFKNADEVWRKVCRIDLTPRDIAFFDDPMSVVYTVPGTSPFHTSLRIVLYSSNGVTAIKDNLHFVEDSNTHLLNVQTEMGDLDEIIDKIKTICPILSDAALIIKQIDSWRFDGVANDS